MKKLIWILLLMFIVGCVTSCAIVKASVPITMPDGSKEIAKVNSYRIFTQANLTYMPNTGLTYSSSSNLGESIAALGMLAEVAGNMYMKSQTGGLVSTPQAVLVPKAEAQATPPPAQ